MDTYSPIPAYSVEADDQIIIDNDPVEVREVIDETDRIVVIGWSWTEGDNIRFELDPFAELEQWSI